jgi:hypothetical protein
MASLGSVLQIPRYDADGSKRIKILNIDIKSTGDGPLGAVEAAAISLSCEILVHGSVVPKSEDSLFPHDMAINNKIMALHLIDFDESPNIYNGTFLLLIKLRLHEYRSLSFLMLEATGTAQGQYRRVGHISNERGERDKFSQACKDELCHAKDNECVVISINKDRKKHCNIDLF